jgi:hypothetical protein
MDGALVTGGDVIDWDKTNGFEVLGDAAVLKPGGFAVDQDTDGKFAVTVSPAAEKSIGSSRRAARRRSSAKRSATR